MDLVPQATQGTGGLADTSARATCPTEDATRLPPVWSRPAWSGASAHLVTEDLGLDQQAVPLDRHLYFLGLWHQVVQVEAMLLLALLLLV